MQLSVSGKQVDVGDALRGHVEERLIAAISKHFDRAIEAQVQFSREGHMIRTDISVHAGSGILLQGHATADDIRISFDQASDRGRFEDLAAEVGIPLPPGGTAITAEDALARVRAVLWSDFAEPATLRPCDGDGGQKRANQAW